MKRREEAFQVTIRIEEKRHFRFQLKEKRHFRLQLEEKRHFKLQLKREETFQVAIKREEAFQVAIRREEAFQVAICFARTTKITNDVVEQGVTLGSIFHCLGVINEDQNEIMLWKQNRKNSQKLSEIEENFESQ